ncbi:MULTISPECIES: hypothetical protein [Eubacteriales]|uniref:Uncharacterized protein n=1 Tax=Bittarella massiliensis (ex Durand et al. 2017) TaxID=1720313 RepID=A0AAQ1MBY4_9FIRM|nr:MULTISPECIES: hypothetical protein [Eubacteriales]SHF73554.1 Protein of unknown function [Bittarella massiliensis (ex Durand et al. 2017)]
MTDTERDLRTAMNNLLCMITLSGRMNQTLKELEALFAVSDFEKRIFEQPQQMRGYAEAKAMLCDAVEQIKATYGKQIISEAYEAFKNALSEPAFCKETAIDIVLEKTEAAKLFNDVFNRMVDMENAFPDEADGYLIFVELVREVRSQTTRSDTAADICPYCNGLPSKTAKADFFGENHDDNEGYVWACECGAYAYMNREGNVIGTMADRELHYQRKIVKKILFDLCGTAGMTIYESCRWAAWITGKSLNTVQDVEYLSMEDCDAVRSLYDGVKERLKTKRFQYPHTHGELIKFLEDGGRMMAQNAFGYRYGRLLIPILTGSEAIRIRYQKGIQEVMLPKGLEYRFESDQMMILHPSGKREKYKLFTKEQRLELYQREKKE